MPTLPAPEQFREPTQGNEQVPRENAEKAPVSGERAPGAPATPQPTPPPAASQQPSAQNPKPTPPADPASSSSPTIADDTDVIEKEWVDKAKKIVSATKSDPHQQEKEVSKLQADYLMKRYGKKVKLTE